MLDSLKAFAPDIITTAVIEDAENRGKAVKRFRAYAEGDHDVNLTPKMRAMLRLGSEDDKLVANYCDTVIQTMADRLAIEAINANNETGTVWGNTVRTFNRFDGLQMDVIEAAIRDGDGFISVAFDEESNLPVFYHEPAYDGTDGVIAIYDRTRKSLALVIKIWVEDGQTITTRANLYYPDRIEKYSSQGESGQSFEKYQPEGEEWPVKWTKRDGKPLGVPFIHIPNRKRGNGTHGISELNNIVPMQNSLNRTLVSMVMTAELTAFQLRYALGFEVPDTVTPGMWINVKSEIPNDQQVMIGVLEQGNITDFLAQSQFLIHEIGTISRTPSPEFMGGDNASGESLKQREVGLLGKVRKFQVKGGNAFEDLMMMAAHVADTFAKTNRPPTIERFNCVWMKADIRSDIDVVKAVKDMAGLMGDKQALKELKPVFGWDDATVDAIMMQKDAESTARLNRAGGILPAFSSTAIPTSL